MKSLVFEMSKIFPFVVIRRKSQNMRTDSDRLSDSVLGDVSVSM